MGAAHTHHPKRETHLTKTSVTKRPWERTTTRIWLTRVAVQATKIPNLLCSSESLFRPRRSHRRNVQQHPPRFRRNRIHPSSNQRPRSSTIGIQCRGPVSLLLLQTIVPPLQEQQLSNQPKQPRTGIRRRRKNQTTTARTRLLSASTEKVHGRNHSTRVSRGDQRTRRHGQTTTIVHQFRPANNQLASVRPRRNETARSSRSSLKSPKMTGGQPEESNNEHLHEVVQRITILLLLIKPPNIIAEPKKELRHHPHNNSPRERTKLLFKNRTFRKTHPLGTRSHRLFKCLHPKRTTT